MRYFIEFSYHGAAYHGWQRQKNALTVQEVLEKCASQVLQTVITIQGSSRTDTGVHAAHQMAHFDIDKEIPANFVYRLNSYLPNTIAVMGVHLMHKEANARFDAIGRQYCYRLHTFKNVFINDVSLYFPKKLDFVQMNEAAGLLLNHTDFQCFSKVKTEVFTYNCTIGKAEWIQTKYGWEFNIEANRFLRGMVRAIVGTLILIGEGKIDKKQFQLILNSKDRRKAGVNVKAHALTLQKVIYPKNYFDVK